MDNFILVQCNKNSFNHANLHLFIQKFRMLTPLLFADLLELGSLLSLE